jgi:hypothetical protein
MKKKNPKSFHEKGKASKAQKKNFHKKIHQKNKKLKLNNDGKKLINKHPEYSFK